MGDRSSVRNWLAMIIAAASFLLLGGVGVVNVAADAEVPCYYAFGDSLVDSGNNNNIASLARANYPPYGIDFPLGATGRFTNGLTTVDVIAQQLGFDDLIPSYASASGEQLLTGVNFASAAAGIRQETGQQLGARIPMDGQLQNYRALVETAVETLGGDDAAAAYFSRCIYTVGMGSNDYLNNYFMPQLYATSRQYGPEDYADTLIQQYSQQLQSLYEYGARKVAVVGVGQVGCSPNELAQHSPDGETCIEDINGPIRIFNAKLISLVGDLNGQLDGAHFTYINSYDMFADIAPRFRVRNAGCCGVGRNNGQLTCLPYQAPCGDRDDYLFWDAFHPTAAANILLGRRTYAAESDSDAYPYDIRHLVQL